jgi:hypothetical protein
MPKGTPQETEKLPGTNGEYLICLNGEIFGMATYISHSHSKYYTIFGMATYISHSHSNISLCLV